MGPGLSIMASAWPSGGSHRAIMAGAAASTAPAARRRISRSSVLVLCVVVADSNGRGFAGVVRLLFWPQVRLWSRSFAEQTLGPLPRGVSGAFAPARAGQPELGGEVGRDVVGGRVDRYAAGMTAPSGCGDRDVGRRWPARPLLRTAGPGYQRSGNPLERVAGGQAASGFDPGRRQPATIELARSRSRTTTASRT